eukprot:12899546-Prorocentrum_lima.AAC.1
MAMRLHTRLGHGHAAEHWAASLGFSELVATCREVWQRCKHCQRNVPKPHKFHARRPVLERGPVQVDVLKYDDREYVLAVGRFSRFKALEVLPRKHKEELLTSLRL